MSDARTELRELVQQLTREHTTPVHLRGELIRHRPDPALLDTLANARSTMIGTGGGGRAAHERSALNIAAVELYDAIQRRVRSWALAADVPRHWQLMGGQPVDWSNPTDLLRAWHARVQGIAQFDERPYADTLRGWTNAITDLVLDPPRRWTIAAPCPLCGQRYVLDPDGHQVDSLSVTERDPAEDSITTCRACTAIWPGIGGARQLRIQIDDHERAVGAA